MSDEQPTAAADAASPPPKRVTVEQLADGLPIMQAYKEGRFAALGAPAPPRPHGPASSRSRPW